MGTYIIHFDDKPWEDLDDELYYRCFEIPWFSTTKTTISRLTPYTEDSAYAHGYTEAESKYREIRDELEKQAYQRGYETAKHECEDCNTNIVVEAIRKKAYEKAYERGRKDGKIEGRAEVWVVARDIDHMSDDDIKACFECGFSGVFEKYTASEAIEKIRQYEQEKRFCVGDEFENESGKRFVITKMDGTEIDRYIDKEGTTYCMIAKYKVMRKTGRHFPEIAAVLEKM